MSTVINSKSTVVRNNKEYAVIHIEKTKKICGLCENYTASKTSNKNLVAFMSCEGACLRGEVSRRVANKLSFNEMPENSARVCLGSAFTKDTGQRNMLRSANRVVALEGCSIECGTRMMKGVISDFKPEVIFVDRYYSFNKKLFAINDASEEELEKFSDEAAANIKKLLF
jgi:uncharacterized metal-binding protein